MMNAKGMDPHVDHAELLIENITDCIAEVLRGSISPFGITGDLEVQR